MSRDAGLCGCHNGFVWAKSPTYGFPNVRCPRCKGRGWIEEDREPVPAPCAECALRGYPCPAHVDQRMST
jgi:hypothetical protein